MKIEESGIKYQYHLLTWGGFYNEDYVSIHGHKPGNHLFDTAEERETYVQTLKSISEKLDAKHLALDTSEGYCCEISTVLHRVIEYNGDRYYSNRNMGVNYPLDTARYFLEWKWNPGKNDYPLGEDFDYEKVTTIKEWITGAFQEVDDEW